jgi:hemoglobin-like flavoprotein
MTHEAIVRVQRSYLLLASQHPLAPIFYARLFVRSPATRALFPANMTAQHAHFNVALAMIVRNLEDLDALEEPLRDLGTRHVLYGVRGEDYVLFRSTLLEVLAECAGDSWSPGLREDWWEALTSVITLMLRGASPTAPNRPTALESA